MKSTKKKKRGGSNTWNLGLLYKSDDDSALEADVLKDEQACTTFRKKWHGKISISTSDKQLLASIREYARLHERISYPKPQFYLYLRLAVDSNNPSVQAKLNAISERYAKATNEILFYEIELGALGQKKVHALAQHPSCKAFSHFFQRVAQYSKYLLSEEAEKIISLKSLASRQLWTQGVEKALAKLEVTHNGTTYPLAEAESLVPELPTKDRHEMHAKIMEQVVTVSDFAESEINALFFDKKIFDDLRGYTAPYQETILRYDNDEKAVLSLVETVTDAFSISHDFYKVKKKLLGLSKLTYADRSASVGTLRHTFTFERSCALLRDLLFETKTEYGEIFNRMLADGQIDVFPRKGKGGGAFLASGTGVPSFVMLNHTSDFRSAQTLAHEMGHAIHSERSRIQHPLVESYSTAAAETASTFIESLFVERLLSELSHDEQIIALHDIIQSDVSTIFRQIAFFNYERAAHETVRLQGGIDAKTLASLMNKHMKAYLGPSFTLTELDGYFFVRLPHIRSFFYVYSYAYGQLISKAMRKQYLENSAYIEQVDHFLSAGGSDTPDNIFASIGLDTRKPTIFEAGLQELRNNVTKLKKLMK